MGSEQAAERTTDDGAALRRAAGWRVGLTCALWLAALLALRTGMASLHEGQFGRLIGQAVILFLGVPLVAVGMVSTLIARALFAGSRGGIRAALVFDAILAVPVTLFLAGAVWGGTHGGFSERLSVGAAAAMFALLAGTEVAWLRIHGRRR